MTNESSPSHTEQPDLESGTPQWQPDMALSRWDNEGGAAAFYLPKVRTMGVRQDAEPALTNAELTQLRVRVIALENLVLALLAEASDGQLRLARERAVCISPRPGYTSHPLTLHAAAQMMHLVGNASHLCGGPPTAG